MNEIRALIEETAGRIFRDLCTKELVDEAEKGVWPDELWQTLEEAGLTLASVPEELGGAGGAIGDTMAILRGAGRHAAPVPLADTFLAGWILSGSGLAVPSGPLTLAMSHGSEGLEIERDGETAWTLSGTAHRVPWASKASRIVALATDGATPMVALVDPAGCAIEPGKNLAGEPRDDVTFNDVGISENDVQPAGPLVDAETIRRFGALTRSVLMAGALETILGLSVEHANVRMQFGRAIGKFQAIRQQLAVMAGHVAAAAKAADIATEAIESGDGRLEIAVAKARIGEAAGIAAEISHQVHGAMGITYEHSLHQYTRRLWSWRDEFGAETEWQAEIGRRLAAKGADNLWDFISQT